MSYAMARPAGFSAAGRRIYEAGLRFQRENPYAEETPQQRRVRLAAERQAAEQSRRDAAIAAAAAASRKLSEERRQRWEEIRRMEWEAATAARVQFALEHGYAPKSLRVSDFIAVVCEHFSVSLSAIVSKSRNRRIVRPRQVAMLLARELTPKSLPEIGRRFGGKDHTTILHGCRKIESLIAAGDPIAADVDSIRRKLTGSEELAA